MLSVIEMHKLILFENQGFAGFPPFVWIRQRTLAGNGQGAAMQVFSSSHLRLGEIFSYNTVICLGIFSSQKGQKIFLSEVGCHKHGVFLKQG